MNTIIEKVQIKTNGKREEQTNTFFENADSAGNKTSLFGSYNATDRHTDRQKLQTCNTYSLYGWAVKVICH